jgi:hypothetical protein
VAAGEDLLPVLDEKEVICAGVRPAPSPRAMMAPVEVPVIRSKCSTTEIPRSASKRSSRAAANMPL